jgi:cytochrome c oxidase cbb3-type subunit 3
VPTDDAPPTAPSSSTSTSINPPGPPWWIVGGFLAIVGLGALAFILLREPIGPAPPEIARDPLLSRGREIFLARCIACHGINGQGDGPVAPNLIGPPPGNLTDAEWKHGDRPEQVVRVIAEGVPNTRMDGWGRTLDPPDLDAVAAYVYYLGKRPVPEALRRNYAEG